jgi:hypothetical protein
VRWPGSSGMSSESLRNLVSSRAGGNGEESLDRSRRSGRS